MAYLLSAAILTAWMMEAGSAQENEEKPLPDGFGSGLIYSTLTLSRFIVPLRQPLTLAIGT